MKTSIEETVILDATDQVLGRLAVRAAIILRGKHKPTFLPYRLSGDKVMITNAEKIRVTGRKSLQEHTFRHTGWPRGLRSQQLRDRLEQNPERVITDAVQGMLPKNRLTKEWMKRLTITKGQPTANGSPTTAEQNRRSQ